MFVFLPLTGVDDLFASSNQCRRSATNTGNGETVSFRLWPSLTLFLTLTLPTSRRTMSLVILQQDDLICVASLCFACLFVCLSRVVSFRENPFLEIEEMPDEPPSPPFPTAQQIEDEARRRFNLPSISASSSAGAGS